MELLWTGHESCVIMDCCRRPQHLCAIFRPIRHPMTAMPFPVDHALLAQARAKLADRPLLWIIGGAGAGKTTICQALADRLGLPLYDMDAHIYGSYHGRFDVVRHPINSAWAAAPDGLAWLLGRAWDEFDAFNRAALAEYLDLLGDDLAALPGGVEVIVDGGVSTPAVLADVLPVRRIACLAAPNLSSTAIWEGTAERLAMQEAMAHFADPAAAWRTFLDFDARITQTILAECRQCGIPIYPRTDTTSVEELIRRVLSAEC